MSYKYLTRSWTVWETSRQYRECFKATKIYKDNSHVQRLRVVRDSVCLFNTLNSRTIDIQIPSPQSFLLSWKLLKRQSQNMASARATQEDLILNTEKPSPFLWRFFRLLCTHCSLSDLCAIRSFTKRISEDCWFMVLNMTKGQGEINTHRMIQSIRWRDKVNV